MILIFRTPIAAQKAEARLKKWGLDVEPVPAPKDVSRQCGLALAVTAHDTGQAAKALTVAGLTIVIPARNQYGN